MLVGARSPSSQAAGQAPLHKCKVVRHIEADHALAYQRRPETTLQRASMRLLHNEDQVGPADQFSREWALGIMAGPRGVYFEIFPARKHLLGGRPSQFALATNEQDCSDTCAQSATYMPCQASGYGAASAE